ncbi:MAG TPA: glycosyltransferase 87 family protein [Actinocrinis sp.]|uniref:glycosyltransferase 87 family protein n=1 Tax=Actinocrinis sp. TaxID=1920516 RepID=UPI002D749550|nr:glycosyltransferase 87 family protein [Actinocrinis sp.]HZU56815.1 glycosyltransferase 87 family protein [Actinocrinis sp.]
MSPETSPGSSALRRLASAPVFAPRYRRVGFWWAGTRFLLMLWALQAMPYFSRGSVIGDVYIYSGWANTMTHGSFPSSDPQWQYPPAAALVMIFPKLIAHVGIGYVNSFFFFALAADAVVFTLLIGQADRIAAQTGREAHLSGVWAWVLGGFALGPILFMRYDVIVTALAVGGLVATVKATERRTPEQAEKWTWSVRGVLLGLGAVVKVWPVVLLAGLPGGRRGVRAVVSAVVGAVVICALIAAGLSGALSFLGHQSSRGIEVEAVFASPFMIASWFGYPVSTVHEDGNFQLAGPGTGLVASGAILLTLLGFGIVLWWRARRFHPERWSPALMYDAGFTVLLVMVVTSRVLSPQYLIWLIGLSALCLAENVPDRRRTLMATPARMVMACTLVSQLEFPILFLQVMHHGFLGTAVVAARNLVLLAATVIALRKLWSATTAKEPDPAGPAGSAPGAVPGARSEAEAHAAAGAVVPPVGDLVALQPAGAGPAPAGAEPRGASTR